MSKKIKINHQFKKINKLYNLIENNRYRSTKNDYEAESDIREDIESNPFPFSEEKRTFYKKQD